MSKKTILTTAIILSLAGGAAGYAQYEYLNNIDKGIDGIKAKLLTNGITLDYKERSAMFFNSDIVFKDVLITNPMSQTPFTAKEFTIDRNTFKEDESKLHPYIKFSIEKGSVNIPVINVNDIVDMDYLYSYDKDTGAFVVDIDSKFEKLLDFSFSANIQNAQDIWNYPINNQDANGDPLEVTSVEQLKTAIGDLTLNNFSFYLKDKSAIDSIAKSFVQITQGVSDIEPHILRTLFAKDMRTHSSEEDNLAKIIADFIEKGGEVKIEAKPDKPVLISKAVDDIEKFAKEGKTEIEAVLYFEKLVNLSLNHTPSPDFQPFDLDSYLEKMNIENPEPMAENEIKEELDNILSDKEVYPEEYFEEEMIEEEIEEEIDEPIDEVEIIINDKKLEKTIIY